MKYYLITYGCQMNTADSEEMSQPLKEQGFTATGALGDADIVLMNTCTVREQAEHRADSNIGRLRVWKAKDPHRILIVAGCAASRWGESIQRKYPFIDLVSPATRIEQFPEAIGKVLKERWNWKQETGTAFGNLNGVQDLERRSESGTAFGNLNGVQDLERRSDVRTAFGTLNDVQNLNAVPAPTPFLFGDDNTAYVTIMRGCNYSCSYCIVPQVRGREMYRPMPQILEEIRQKAKQGHEEVMLLGQTVNSYHYRGDDRPYDFADLLRAVNAIDGISRIRFMSPHPKHLRDRVIEAMRDCSKVARHIHLPVQSGSTRMLERMKRLYTREEYLSIVQKLRAAMPSILITTDMIVGFPGETQTDFNDTLSLLQEAQFNGLFAFKYSPRPGTTSAEEIDDVTDDEKENRLQQVLALNTGIKAAQALAS